MAIRNASDGQEHWLMNSGGVAKIRSKLHTGQYMLLVVFPLTTARDRRWWSHCHSLGSPEMSTSFFARQLKKGAVDLPYTVTPVVSIATGSRLKVVIVKKVIVFLAFVGLSISCYTAWYVLFVSLFHQLLHCLVCVMCILAVLCVSLFQTVTVQKERQCLFCHQDASSNRLSKNEINKR